MDWYRNEKLKCFSPLSVSLIFSYHTIWAVKAIKGQKMYTKRFLDFLLYYVKKVQETVPFKKKKMCQALRGKNGIN